MSDERGPHPIAMLEHNFEQNRAKVAALLPAHIPVEKFKRVLMTAMQNAPSLMNSTIDPRSVFTAVLRAAQDGLMPDVREGAIVAFKGRAQWMPMAYGIRKLARNTGEITMWETHVVHENDSFEFELGDDPFIRHKPNLKDPGPPIAAYSVAKLRSGEVSREVMSVSEIEKVRSMSRAQRDDSPWVTWWDEMARKTVLKRHAKSLPMSTDLEGVISREDGDTMEQHEPIKVTERKSLGDKLKELTHDPETGEIEDSAEARPPATADGGEGQADTQPASPVDTTPKPSEAPPEVKVGKALADALSKAYKIGREARHKGMKRTEVPVYRGEHAEKCHDEWLVGYDDQVATEG